jgi:murein DD-endopeptidase MepM/ murein hydrolase activator NlpD
MRPDPDTPADKMHDGIDLKAPLGTAVMAPADGEVVEAGKDDMHGKYLTLRHDAEYTTRYFHLDEVSVSPGEAVEAGKEIGKVGTTGRSSGPHLHYEVRKNGEAVDPAEYF